MSGTAARMVVWLLVLAFPAQGLAALITALHGPAHYHSIQRTPLTSRAPVARADHAHASRVAHSHDQVRRHYHLPGEGAVVVLDASQQNDAAAAQSRGADGEPAGAAFVALVSRSPQLYSPRLTDAVRAGATRKLLSCIPRRIERPPRSSRFS